jgi:hypothetical protein
LAQSIRRLYQIQKVPVKKIERQGSLVLIDIEKVIRSQSFGVPDIERLTALITKLENQYPNKTIFVIADMSVFHHLKKAKDLLDYEKSLHQDIKVEKWKELCLYHERDFRLMFTEKEADELLEYHKDKVIQF